MVRGTEVLSIKSSIVSWSCSRTSAEIKRRFSSRSWITNLVPNFNFSSRCNKNCFITGSHSTKTWKRRGWKMEIKSYIWEHSVSIGLYEILCNFKKKEGNFGVFLKILRIEKFYVMKFWKYILKCRGSLNSLVLPVLLRLFKW